MNPDLMPWSALLRSSDRIERLSLQMMGGCEGG